MSERNQNEPETLAEQITPQDQFLVSSLQDLRRAYYEAITSPIAAVDFLRAAANFRYMQAVDRDVAGDDLAFLEAAACGLAAGASMRELGVMLGSEPDQAVRQAQGFLTDIVRRVKSSLTLRRVVGLNGARRTLERHVERTVKGIPCGDNETEIARQLVRFSGSMRDTLARTDYLAHFISADRRKPPLTTTGIVGRVQATLKEVGAAYAAAGAPIPESQIEHALMLLGIHGQPRSMRELTREANNPDAMAELIHDQVRAILAVCTVPEPVVQAELMPLAVPQNVAVRPGATRLGVEYGHLSFSDEELLSRLHEHIPGHLLAGIVILQGGDGGEVAAVLAHCRISGSPVNEHLRPALERIHRLLADFHATRRHTAADLEPGSPYRQAIRLARRFLGTDGELPIALPQALLGVNMAGERAFQRLLVSALQHRAAQEGVPLHQLVRLLEEAYLGRRSTG